MKYVGKYRYYAEDMIHPNSLAINYIWEKFSLFSFDEKVKEEIKEFEKITNNLEKLFSKSNHPNSTHPRLS